VLFLIQHIPSQFFHLVSEDPFRPFRIHQIPFIILPLGFRRSIPSV
jgi:hypothetical protein